VSSIRLQRFVRQPPKGGVALASKLLLERLEPTNAADLGLDPDEMTYVTIGRLDGSSEKAVRDAGSISVTTI
jgi:hypothetical protein